MAQFPVLSHAACASALAGRRVLLSDADEAWLQAMRLKLIGLGAVVFTVSSALEGAASAAGQTFDAVILEAEPAAFDAVRRIRALPGTPGPALIGLYPTIGPATPEHAENAGFDGFMRHCDALDALASLLALLAPRSIRTAELDDVQQENHNDERADSDERHVSPRDDKVSGAL